MPVVTIPVGSYTIWTLNVTATNGQPDTTSPITATAAQGGFVQIDPVSSSPGNRQFYVTGLVATGNLSLIATTQAGKQVFVQVEVSQPDLSGITSAGFGAIQPGPHPAGAASLASLTHYFELK